MQSAGIETLSGTPEQCAGLIKTEIVRWARVVKEVNLSVEKPDIDLAHYHAEWAVATIPADRARAHSQVLDCVTK